ncbi:hypothetical protein GIY30_02310 [Gordonia sp. HNM0687]|uniref:RCK N-terminal domain-containing protein n=1 Tax=Gordonia mangrovi TaxID=2665643 RepID=A0A6L7GJW8_9ACTN|nr:hypothetical protein [Gordonia mangrovi]MXP20204.1 hypothetical protein [Gordonia mangrovi]UVF79188.1 PGDYG domain-containing protein [Gordonia mangrovi]
MSDGEWKQFNRRGEVDAVRLDSPWTWQTENGDTLQARAGDWRITDTDGNQRSVAAELFPRSYEFVAPGRYRRVGMFRARQVSAPETLVTLEGPARAHEGDWVVEGASGEHWPVPADQFSKTYEEIRPPSRPTRAGRWFHAAGITLLTLVQAAGAVTVQRVRSVSNKISYRSRTAIPTLVPTILTVWAISAALVGFWAVATTYETAQKSFIQQVYSTMAMFTGGYIPLIGDQFDPVPPVRIAAASVFAFTLTIAAASGVVIKLSARAWHRTRSWIRRPRLVVVGSGHSAAAIVRSCAEHKIRALLITEEPDGEAARACGHLLPKVEMRSFAECGDFGVARHILSRAENVVIATDSDSRNLDLQSVVGTAARRTHVTERFSVVSVVKDAKLVEAMRPQRLTTLPDQDVTCPAENVAEHVCHLIDAIATGSAAMSKAHPDDTATAPLIDAVVVDVIDVDHHAPADRTTGEPLSATLRRWLLRQSWSRKFMWGNEDLRTQTTNEVIDIRLRTEDDAARDNSRADDTIIVVRIYVGADSSAVMTRVLEDRSTLAAPPSLTVVVGDGRLITTAMASFDSTVSVVPGRQWLSAIARIQNESTIAYVDPDEIGLDAHLVTDDIRLQWARLFNQTYEFMFAEDRAIKGWLPGEPLASETKTVERAAARKELAEWWGEIPAEPRNLVGAGTRIKTSRRNARKRISNWYSSESAVKNMLTFLDDEGWELRRFEGPGAPDDPNFPDAMVERIAAREHADWRRRWWPDDSRRRRPRYQRPVLDDGTLGKRRLRVERKIERCATYSGSGADVLTFDELSNLSGDYVDGATSQRPAQNRRTANYNRRIVRETYPAIAACFGYQIVRKPEKGDATR